MKNFKKLFIALPLVLVMLFSAVPVFAETAVAKSDKVKANTLGLDLKLGETVESEAFKATTRQVPIWGAVKTYHTNDDANTSINAGPYVLLNGGKPLAWEKYSSLVATEFMIGKNAVETLDAFANYVLPTYQINHVEKVETTVKVPQSWTEEGLDKIYKLKEGYQRMIVGGNNFYDEDILDTTEGLSYEPNEDGTAGTVTYRGQKTMYVLYVGEDDPTIRKIRFKDDLYYYPAGLDVTDEIEIVKDGDKTTYFIEDNFENKIEVKVNIEDAPEKFVEASLWGLLVIVEEKYVDVKVNHHYITGENEEIVQTAEVKQEKGVALTDKNIKAEWLKEVGEFKYDPTRTVVTEKTNKNELIIGETIVESYVVDLFYTAGEGANADEIDAAFAGTTTAVANANVANLPATGAASNFALILSSAALAVVGLFLKK